MRRYQPQTNLPKNIGNKENNVVSTGDIEYPEKTVESSVPSISGATTQFGPPMIEAFSINSPRGAMHCNSAEESDIFSCLYLFDLKFTPTCHISLTKSTKFANLVRCKSFNNLKDNSSVSKCLKMPWSYNLSVAALTFSFGNVAICIQRWLCWRGYSASLCSRPLSFLGFRAVLHFNEIVHFHSFSKVVCSVKTIGRRLFAFFINKFINEKNGEKLLKYFQQIAFNCSAVLCEKCVMMNEWRRMHKYA